MDTSPYEALATAAADGVDFDGLTANRADGQLTVSSPETELTAPASAPRSALDPVGEYVTNWYYWHATTPQDEARWAFLRWLERADELAVPERYDALADGLSRSWGQLQVTVTLDEAGRRRYDLRHEADAGVGTADLDHQDDPGDAREVAKLDERGRYRPLKTAPTLRSGWVFDGVDAGTLLETIGYLYPATVANWHREREGELDVTHWHEAVARQTGIYGVVETWDRGEGHEHVEWVAEACCADSECRKRREWDYDDETPLEADGGDGQFPCREPCSIVIAAARKWTKLEGEQTRSYEFDLTPSEKAQIEAIVDAVADGRIDDIREADLSEGANRYRTRFLRAKRFDEAGNLCGVETDET